MGTKKLADLNEHLFNALERLSEDGMSQEKVDIETQKCKAIVDVSNQIIQNARVTLEAMRLTTTGSIISAELPETFGIKRLKD